MRAAAIKQELAALGVPCGDCFEKADLERRLASARKKASVPATAAGGSARPAEDDGRRQGAAPRSVRLPMRKIRSSAAAPKEYLLLPLRLGGPVASAIASHDFVIDTGSSSTLVDARFARRALGLAPGAGTPSRGLGGMGAAGGQGRQVPLDDVSLGDLPCRSIQAVVMDLSYAGLGDAVAGIVGLDVLKQFDVDFDFPALSMTFSEPGAAAVPVYAQGLVLAASAALPFGLPALKVKINDGPEVTAILDMGSALSLINWRTARAAGLSPTTPGVRPAPMTVVGIGGGSMPMSLTTLKAVRIQMADKRDKELALQPPFTAIGDLPALDKLGAGMIMGLDVLASLRILIPSFGSSVCIGKSPSA
eukprot:SM000113S24095  [mRNA]  locus=s113:342588:344260:- [translate_table: standard]